MANMNEFMTNNIPPPDPIGVLGKLGVLSKSRLEKVRTKVLSGEFPSEFNVLIERLVLERILTSYQGRRILSGRTNELVLGPYILLRRVAKGEMGRVYKAFHPMLGRVVAIKVVAANVPSQRAISRFRREMRLVGRLDHPNIVAAYDAGRSNGVFFIAMEYLSGLTLKAMLDLLGPLPPAKAVGYAAEAARGLAHAHSRGIVHGDVKPSNIMLSEGERIKILDLGIGTLMDELGGTASGEVGKLSGTFEYISPEQASQKPFDGRSDLYSLGCTLYHLIQGRLPFSDRPWIERVAIRVTGEHEPITIDLADEPPGLVAVMEKLLAHNPKDRFQTADAAAEALLGLVRGEVAAADPTLSPARGSSIPPTARRGWLTKSSLRSFAAAALLLAFGFGYLSLAPELKRESSETGLREVARPIGQVDATHGLPSAATDPNNEPSRAWAVLPSDVASRLEDVAERPSVKWSRGWALVRLASILPPDLKLVRQALIRIPRHGPFIEFGPDLTVGLPKQGDVSRIPAVSGPAQAAKLPSTAKALVPREAESKVPSRTEPLQRMDVVKPREASFAAQNVSTKVVLGPSLGTTRGVETSMLDGSVRRSTSTEDLKTPPIPKTVPVHPPTQPPLPSSRDPSRPGPSEVAERQEGRDPKTATIHVFMPTRNSELVVRGAVGRGNPDEWYGTRRVIHTPPFEKTTSYLVGAFWTDPSGKPTVRQTNLKVIPGHVYQVDLRPDIPTFAEVAR